MQVALVGLLWEDVDFDNHSIRVWEQISRAGERGRRQSRKSRTVPMIEQAAEPLGRLKDRGYLFASTARLQGPLSKALADIDLSYIVGFLVGGAVYWAMARRALAGPPGGAAPPDRQRVARARVGVSPDTITLGRAASTRP